MLNRCKAFAKKNGGELMNEFYGSFLIYKCANNHMWAVSYKSRNTKWCKECIEIEKE